MLDKKLIILCGPSGSGKTTLAQHLLKHVPDLAFSISATTRSRRENEIDGRDYYFLSADAFRRKIENDEFLEFEEVYPGTFYGTLKSELERIWSEDKIPVLDIDVLGAKNIKQDYHQALAIFVHPVSIENIHQRLKKRATEDAESFEKRVGRAVEELNMSKEFDKIVYNDNLGPALQKTEQYIYQYLLGDQKLKA